MERSHTARMRNYGWVAPEQSRCLEARGTLLSSPLLCTLPIVRYAVELRHWCAPQRTDHMVPTPARYARFIASRSVTTHTAPSTARRTSTLAMR